MGRPTRPIEVKICLNCQHEFKRDPKLYGSRGFAKRKYCSHLCWRLAEKGLPKKLPIEIACAECGKAISGPPSAFRRNKRFCSQYCSSALVNHSCYRGGRFISKGYIFLSLGRGNRIAEHRQIAEKALGRKLNFNEVVHHINGNKTDNRNENLLICTTSYHRWLHEEMSRRYQQEHFA